MHHRLSPASAEVGPAGSRLFCYCWGSMGVCLGLRGVLRLTKGTVLRLSLWKKSKYSFAKNLLMCLLPVLLAHQRWRLQTGSRI